MNRPFDEATLRKPQSEVSGALAILLTAAAALWIAVTFANIFMSYLTSGV